MYYLVKSELKLGITILLSVPSAALKIESCGSSPFFLLPALLFPIWQDSWAVVRWFMGSALDNLPASNNIKTSHTGKHQTSKHLILKKNTSLNEIILEIPKTSIVVSKFYWGTDLPTTKAGTELLGQLNTCLKSVDQHVNYVVWPCEERSLWWWNHENIFFIVSK